VATHPIQTSSRVVGFAKGVVVGGIGLTEVLRKTASGDAPAPAPATDRSTEPAPSPSPAPESSPSSESEPSSEPVEPDEPTGEYVPPPPRQAPPVEPPVDVVGEALAAEAAADPADLTGGMQGEPHPVTREEEHEGAPFVRAEREEIDEETEEGLVGDELP
jgi:hypothetical protein